MSIQEDMKFYTYILMKYIIFYNIIYLKDKLDYIFIIAKGQKKFL